MEHTPDPQLPVYGLEISSYLCFGVPPGSVPGVLFFKQKEMTQPSSFMNQ